MGTYDLQGNEQIRLLPSASGKTAADALGFELVDEDGDEETTDE